MMKFIGAENFQFDVRKIYSLKITTKITLLLIYYYIHSQIYSHLTPFLHQVIESQNLKNSLTFYSDRDITFYLHRCRTLLYFSMPQ